MFRYEAAGDQYVGRTVSGLPISSQDFALLPPFFITRNDIVLQTVQKCFPRLPGNMHLIAEFCLASVVYHRNYLEQTLPENHMVFETVLYREAGLLESLQDNVECRLPREADSVNVTGIPPHIDLLIQMNAVVDEIHQVIPAIQEVAPNVIQGVITVLEERCIEAGTVTRNGLESMLDACLEKAGVMRMVELAQHNNMSRAHVDASVTPDNEQAAEPQQRQAFLWKGSFHAVPEDFEFPRGGVLQAWQFWCCGHDENRWPPLRTLVPHDMSTRNKKKRLCDFRFLMNEIESEANQQGNWDANNNVNTANEIFSAAQSVLPMDLRTKKNRKRRPGQMRWTTMVNLLREKKKQRLEEE